MYEIFENHQYLYVVTELLVGGELFDRIMHVGVFSGQCKCTYTYPLTCMFCHLIVCLSCHVMSCVMWYVV